MNMLMGAPRLGKVEATLPTLARAGEPVQVWVAQSPPPALATGQYCHHQRNKGKVGVCDQIASYQGKASSKV